MDSIIKNDSISFDEVKANIEAWLSNLSNIEEIKDSLPASTITLIVELMAGYDTYQNIKNQRARGESYLTSALLPSSVYLAAKAFGYNINRYTSPSLKVRYLEVPTITLTRGDIIGTYGSYELIYYGETKKIEKLDLIDVMIGHFQTIEKSAYYLNNEIVIQVDPVLGTSVDNNLITILVNDSVNELTRNVEDYVVTGNAVDHSLDPYSTSIYISDRANSYGISLTEGDNLKIEYVETDGKMDSIVLKDVILNPEYQLVSINSYGSSGDALTKIKRLAPLLYSTLRRMVTSRDHKYITESHPLIKSVSVERDLGIGYKVQLTVINTTDRIKINVYGNEYIINPTVNDTLETLTVKLYNDLKTITQVTTTLNGLIIIVESVDARVDPYINAYSNVHMLEVTANVKPSCCTVHLVYIKTGTTDEPIPLTAYEQSMLSSYLSQYKLVGERLVMSPASVVHHDFKCLIKLTDPTKYFDEVKSRIASILSEYELNLETSFDYGTALVKIANIKIQDGNDYIYPVISILPNQTVFSVTGSKLSYIKFRTIDVQLVG